MGNNEEYLDNLLKSMGDSEPDTAVDINKNAELEDVALPEDLLEDLLQKFSEEQGLEYTKAELEDGNEAIQETEPETESVPEEDGSYTVESTLNMSAEEIEQLLAQTEEQAETDVQNITGMDSSVDEILPDDMDNEDLLALLGSLDANTDALEAEQENSFRQEEQEGFISLTSDEIKVSVKEKRESAKEKRERKKLEKKERKAAKKAVKEAAKEAKKAEQMLYKDLEEGLEEVVSGAGDDSVFSAADGIEDGAVSVWDLADGDEESIKADDNVSVIDDAIVNDTEAVIAWDELLGLDDDVQVASVAEDEPVKASQKENIGKKKGGAFSRLFSFLTEEDEEENLSDENRNILEELDEEDRKAADKKKKDKKAKKGKGDAERKKGQEDGEEDGAQDDKKKKKEKKKKEKKTKKIKEVELKVSDFEHPPKRLSSKSVAVIIAFAVTLFCVIYFGATYFSTQLQRANAKEAFLRMDYPSCYADFYGIELNEEEQEMLKHAGLVMKMQHYIELYSMYMEESKELEAVDSLMQLVTEYEDTYAAALDCGAGPEIASLYEEALEILKLSYGLNQEDVRDIADCESNVEYTRYLTALVEEGSYHPENSDSGDELQDMLPVEDELLNPDFAD